MSANERPLPERMPVPDQWPGRLLAAVTERLDGWLRNTLNFVLVVAAALIAGIPLFYIAGSDPFTAYEAMLEGSLGSDQRIAETLVAAIPLVIAGLAVALAFHAGLFNVGVEGQLVVGGLVGGLVGSKLAVPSVLHIPLCLIASFLGGAAWALVPGLLKAFRGVHEVISTIMLNYVAFSFSRFLVRPGGPLESADQPAAMDPVRGSAELPLVWGGTRLHAGLFLALLLAVAVWCLLFRTPLGYRLRVLGRNPVAARYYGVSVPRATVQAMLISGGLAGVAGGVQVLGVDHRYFDSFSPGYGFDAIGVALLGLLAPLGVVAAGVLFGVLRAGTPLLQFEGISRDFASVFAGTVVIFAAVVPAVLARRFARRSKRARVASLEPVPAAATEEP